MRAPHLYYSLRCFCLAAFSLLQADVEAGDDIPFAFEEHAGGLCEYRPLLRSYVQARAHRLGALADARIALEELAREPAAAVYGTAHGGGEDALLRTILRQLHTRGLRAVISHRGQPAQPRVRQNQALLGGRVGHGQAVLRDAVDLRQHQERERHGEQQQ